jgi:hypothetical protein
MAKVKLNLAKRSVPDKVKLGRRVQQGLTNNPHFQNTSPDAAAAKAATDALEKAETDMDTAYQTAQQRTVERDQAEAEFDALFTNLSLEVEKVSKGDPAKIESSGMNTKAAAAPIGELPAPAHVRAVPGKREKTVDLRWNRVKGAVNYVVAVSDTGALDDSGKWTQAGLTTRARISCNSFTSGTRRWFRIAAIGTAGQGPWSDPTTAIAS